MGIAFQESAFDHARPPFTVHFGFGRLLEVRLRQLRNLDDLSALGGGLERAARVHGPRCIVYGDHRAAKAVPPHVSDAWSRCMRTMKPNVALSAILLHPQNVTFNLQLERIVRCACNGSRRIFYDGRELREWLKSETTAIELRRLDQLLAEPPPV